jgi:hypothetical protein
VREAKRETRAVGEGSAPWAPGTLLDFFYLTGYVVFGVGVMLAADHEEFLGEEIVSLSAAAPEVIRQSS